jgi:RNA polymerase sigma-70 factor (ECF subfamily)
MKGEPALIRDARKLDPDAWMAIFDKYAPAIFRYALRFCHDPNVSDNIVGDVFAQLLEDFAAGRGPITNLRVHIYQIAYHSMTNSTSHQRFFPGGRAIDSVDNLVIRSGQPEVEELESILDSRLSEAQWHVVLLRFFEDFTLRETAAIISKNVNNVKVIQNRAITKLRKSLEAQSKNDSA